MEKDNFNNNSHRSNPFKIKWSGLFVALFLAFFLGLALSNVVSPYLSQILSGLLSGITPILLGIVIAFVFYKLVDFIERVLLKNAFVNSPYKFGIKRFISITAVLLILVGIVALIFSILVPKIIEIVEKLTAGGGDGGTQLYNQRVNEICALIQKLFGAEISQDSIKDILNSVFESFMQTIGYLNNILELSMNVLSGLLNVIMGLLIGILILKDKEKISRFSRRFTYANFRKDRADELCVMAGNANKILYNYIISKLIEFVIIFVSLGLTFMIIGLEFTWELALIIGLFNFIPYFGIYIGTLPAVLITLIFDSIDSALYMAIATIIITTIEFNTIVPFITGKKLKVNSLLVVTSIIVGGAMFGVMGMLFAPPIIALISVVVMGNIELKENHKKYVEELNKAREKNLQEEQERLGLGDKVRSDEIESNKDESISKEINKQEKKETTKELKRNKKVDEDNKKATKLKNNSDEDLKSKQKTTKKIKNDNIKK